MAYCITQDLIDRFGETELVQLTDRTNSSLVNADVVASAIADAEALIDSYLTRYTLPLTDVPRILTAMACDIVRYRLWADRPSETVALNYQNSLKFLRDLASGAATIGAESGITTPTATAGITVSAPTAALSEDILAYMP